MRRPLISGASLSELLASAGGDPDEELSDGETPDEPETVRIDPDCAEKLEHARGRILNLIKEKRPRFVPAFELMTFRDNTISVSVPTTELREEILRSKTGMLMRIAELAGIEGMIELEVTVNEEIRAARPIKLEDRVRYITEKNPLVAELRKALDLEVEYKERTIKMATKNFIEELEWRGMIHTIMPGAKEQLEKEMTTAYLGIDPTADSLHIGHLVGVMILKHFQMCGHRPLALIGGATGMIGDPSGKSQERNLLDEPTLRHNQEAIKRQLAKLLDFESDAPNAAVLVNNYDWMKDISFLEFIRDIGKCITVNYMMAKDSVKKRFSGEGDGMSFTEFTYQLVQGFDFLHLYQTMNCKVQLGGADQWGNITTGTELIRRKLGNEAEAFAITCPLITKADGTKFGKTESGNVWLDARYTSPYKFYQFWLNVSDEDAKRYIRIFTLLDRETVEALTAEHEAAPHLRVLQKRLAQEITTMIHSREEYEKAVEASAILFGGSTSEALRKIDEETLLQVFEGVPQFRIARAELGLPFVDLCAEKTQVFPSKGECRKMVQGGGVSLNKEKVADPARTVGEADLIAGKYLLVQRGKKNYYLVIAE